MERDVGIETRATFHDQFDEVTRDIACLAAHVTEFPDASGEAGN